MTRPNKRRRLVKEMVKERERQRKIRKLQESESRSIQERGWVSSEDEEDVTAIGLIQVGADSESDESDDDEVIVSEGEELEQAECFCLTTHPTIPRMLLMHFELIT